MKPEWLQAREKLLAGGYGKFDLVEDVLSVGELLHGKPRRVAGLLCLRLEMDSGAVCGTAFYSFLRRYRCRNHEHSLSLPGGTATAGGEAKGWQDFVPSKPSIRQPGIEDILRPARYDDEP